jgi:hypothetical protein
MIAQHSDSEFGRIEMKSLVAISFAVIALALAAPAHAQAENQTVNPDPCQGTMDMDTCMWSDSGPMVGGNYTTCTAVGSKGQGCQSIVSDIFIGKSSCATVYYSASCDCNKDTFATTGQCTYQK